MEAIERDVSWQPKSTNIQKVIHYLNLTQDKASHYLPLTLDGPLLLSNYSLCLTEDGSPVDILFFVHTAPAHVDRRQKLRETFMESKYFLALHFTVRRVFLLGRVKNPTEQLALEEEHRHHGDLVQGDFLDSYRNLSHKGVMGYGWVTRYCARVRLVVKLDDDVFFDTFKLIHRYWPQVVDKRRAIFCSVWKNNTKPVLRDGKWAVSGRLFGAKKMFPYDYCSGLTVMITGDLVPFLFGAARFTPVFWIDDIYLFGILPVIAANVTFYDVGYRKGVMDLQWERGLTCMKEKGHNCPLLAAAARGEQLDAMWNQSLTMQAENHWRNPSVRV
ncbi:beta-1,3-galactosyltransferase 5-like [Littorina saxatilis]|uniref:beta-1,3-galactosyltransferase 5-like n=1 Tax=Littorina saxatilis TaxID=31220 RepID=UPI0038B53A49